MCNSDDDVLNSRFVATVFHRNYPKKHDCLNLPQNKMVGEASLPHLIKEEA